ncbi:MAG: hypothetical protein KGH49_02180 [Candidatus Micrarchaeota archaeon]|nr:hypothetical protein [Candidatus Micrarchaeota archaeon]
MSITWSILLEELPIFAGALLLLVATRFNPYSKRFILQHHGPRFVPLQPNAHKQPNEMYDSLIINGIFPEEMESGAIERLAFERLGVAKLNSFAKLYLGSKVKPASVSLTATHLGRFASAITEKSPLGGILISYMLGSGLKIMVAE